MTKRIVFHIDVNSAYLSWEAVYRLQMGAVLDLRTVPAVVGGDIKKRRGIVLAKSIPAKAFNIQTGEALAVALQKCPTLKVVKPSYGLYIKCHNEMLAILKEYSQHIKIFSIDECFIDVTDTLPRFNNDYLALAELMKNRIRDELGFSVNVGISHNKLLAKVASDFKKPDQIHTLFPEEMASKMWPLPVEDLFMVGRATRPKLNAIGIFTIGDLATFDRTLLTVLLKKHGDVIWKYANGIEDTLIDSEAPHEMKGLGNSTTIPFDVEDRETAKMYLLALSEMVSMRLRDKTVSCGLVSTSLKTNTFEQSSRQKKLCYYTDHTNDIFKEALELFDLLWDGTPLRHLGVRVSDLTDCRESQISFFEKKDKAALYQLDTTIDALRLKYGNQSIIRSSFLHTGIKPVIGGMAEDDYPLMSSML